VTLGRHTEAARESEVLVGSEVLLREEHHLSFQPNLAYRSDARIVEIAHVNPANHCADRSRQLRNV
jgi:hypothetical protein